MHEEHRRKYRAKCYKNKKDEDTSLAICEIIKLLSLNFETR